MNLIRQPFSNTSSWPGLCIALVFPALLTTVILPQWVSIDEPGQSIIGLTGMWLFSLLLLAYIRLAEKKSLASVGLLGISLKQVFVAIGVGFILSMLVPLFYTFLAQFFVTDHSITNAVTGRSPYLILAGIFTAAVTEELLIRAYPLERMERIFRKKWPSVVISVLAFVVLHLDTWSIAHVLGVVFPLGLVLTFLYIRTRNLLFMIIVHFCIDLPLFVMALMK